MTYELIDVETGNTVAAFETFDEGWDALMESPDGVVLAVFDSEGHALGGASYADYIFDDGPDA